jgi:hypothetical protein
MTVKETLNGSLKRGYGTAANWTQSPWLKGAAKSNEGIQPK